MQAGKEMLSEIHAGSTRKITQGYLTIEVTVPSKSEKIPLPFYKKVL